MSITRKEASEMARKGRLEQSAKNLEMIYDIIDEHTERGKNKMTIKGEHLLPEVMKELKDNGYTVHPNEGADYDNPTGVWTIYWGYSDDEPSNKLFKQHEIDEAFS